MNNLAKKLSLVFAAGCLGGLLNSLAVWIFGVLGVTSALGVKIAPSLSAPWLYPRLIWGGIWGLLFLSPLMQRRFLYRGLIFSLGPTLVQQYQRDKDQRYDGHNPEGVRAGRGVIDRQAESGIDGGDHDIRV